MSGGWKQLFRRGGGAESRRAHAEPAGASAPGITSTSRGEPETSPEALIAAGNALEDSGEFESALEHYQRAMIVAPAAPRAYLNASNALRHLHRYDEARSILEDAIAVAPDYAPAHFNLGALLKDRGDLEGAERELIASIRLQPSMVESIVVLADLYELTKRLDQAEESFERALRLAPRNAAATLNYGMFESRRLNFDKAISLFERARSLEPGFKDVLSVMLFSLNLRADVNVHTIADLHRRIGLDITSRTGDPFTSWANVAFPDKLLRVGYVSGDFKMHPVAVFLRPILEQHDRNAFEVYCYSNTLEPHPVGDFLRVRSDHWRDISRLSDNELAELVRHDEIDVLVDLSGHTERHRLPVFARHPAPVQATWLGYLNTTGLPAMDYRICDWNTDPQGSESLNTETLVRMPASQWCYMPWHKADPVELPHVERPDAIVFGSFNQDRKISDACLDAWATILRAVPMAELVVLDFADPDGRKRFLERMEARGVDGSRVSVRGRESIARYFETIGNVDIALDTFPYGGATTTLDTLWMGVPIVGLRGDRGISRGSYSILKSLRADELIAYSVDQYVELNVKLALDRAWRRGLRQTLRDRLLGSPLMDTKGFTGALESCYRDMWMRWCAARAAHSDT